MARPSAFAGMLCILACGSALAQETTVTVDRGLTEDLPYTLIFPDSLRSVDDGSPITIATLQHPNAPLQCDAMIAEGGPATWNADAALQTLDIPGTEASWVTDFPGFTIANTGLVQFQSGPALLYEGKSENSPLGVPASIVHAEAVDGGRTYILECLTDASIAADARPLIDFLIANFSTRSDGDCCIDPAAAQ